MEGSHIKVLGRGDIWSLGDAATVRAFVCELIDQLGMRMLGEPQVHDVEQDIRKLGAEPFEDEGGVTVTAVLSTSHVALHTWPLRAEILTEPMFVLDAFSCREFDHQEVLGLLTKRFSAHSMEVHDLGYTLAYAKDRASLDKR